MATYIMLSTLTDEGRKTLKERPERLQEVNREIARFVDVMIVSSSGMMPSSLTEEPSTS